MKRKQSILLTIAVSILLSPMIHPSLVSGADEIATYPEPLVSTAESSLESSKSSNIEEDASVEVSPSVDVLNTEKASVSEENSNSDETLGSEGDIPKEGYQVYQNGVALGIFGDRETAIREAKKWADSLVSTSGSTVWNFGDHKFTVFQSSDKLGSFDDKQSAISEALKWAGSLILHDGDAVWNFGDHRFTVLQSGTSLGSFDTKYGAIVEALKWAGSDIVQNGEIIWNYESFSPEDSANGTKVFYYCQEDPRWRNTLLGKKNTIGVAGCGPTSLATVISSLTDRKVDPVIMSKWTYQNGYYAEGAGSYHSLIPAGARAFGLNVESVGLANSQKLIGALSEGKMVVALMSRGHFTRTGHFIVLRGISKSGKILVSDPLSRMKSEMEWPISTILNEARRGASAGGPFWIIGN